MRSALIAFGHRVSNLKRLLQVEEMNARADFDRSLEFVNTTYVLRRWCENNHELGDFFALTGFS
jgi:hypothetical protein